MSRLRRHFLPHLRTCQQRVADQIRAMWLRANASPFLVYRQCMTLWMASAETTPTAPARAGKFSWNGVNISYADLAQGNQENTMKRFVIVEYQDASPEVQRIYDDIMETAGVTDVFNFLKAFGNNERVLRGFWSILKNVLLSGEVPMLLKQLILFRISVEYGNTYCASLHGQTILRIDPTITYDELLTISHGGKLDIPASYEVALDLITQMALQPKTVAREDFNFEEQLRDEGFSEQEIDELISVAGFGVLLNTMTDIVLVPTEDSPAPGTKDMEHAN